MQRLKVPINSRPKAIRSQVTGKHFADREFQSVAVRLKKLSTYTPL